MKMGWKWTGAVVTFFAAIAIEAWIESYTGFSLNEFYYLDLVLQAVNNTFMPSMPTTGSFAQATANTVFFTGLVQLMLSLIPAILLAAGVYRLIPDKH